MARIVVFTSIWILAVSYVIRDVSGQDFSKRGREEADIPSYGRPGYGRYQPESKRKLIAGSDPSHKIISDIRKLAERWQNWPEQALGEIDALIEKHTNSNQLKPLAELSWQKTFALLRLNRNIEALIEAKKAEKMCAQIPECYSSVMRNLIIEIETKMKQAGDYAVLGIPPSSDLSETKKAYRRLLLLLHPDKNPGIDSEEKEFMKHLFIIVSESHKRLVAEKRHS